jgi:hypothetical protein
MGHYSHHLLLYIKYIVSILFENPPERFALRGIHDKKFLERKFYSVVNTAAASPAAEPLDLLLLPSPASRGKAVIYLCY